MERVQLGCQFQVNEPSGKLGGIGSSRYAGCEVNSPMSAAIIVR
jgi:hypothetical protein